MTSLQDPSQMRLMAIPRLAAGGRWRVEAMRTLSEGCLLGFTKGQGRHQKDGVRISVGQKGCALIVSLPGPNDEVREGMQALKEGLAAGLGKQELAAHIAGALSRRLMRQAHQWNHDEHHK